MNARSTICRRLQVEPAVSGILSALVAAQIEIANSADRSARETKAVAARRRLLKKLTPAQKSSVGIIFGSLAHAAR